MNKKRFFSGQDLEKIVRLQVRYLERTSLAETPMNTGLAAK